MRGRRHRRRRRRMGRGRGIREQILTAQRNEITEYHIYCKLADQVENRNDSKVLSRIADEERKHAEFWKTHTQKEIKPNKLKVAWHSFLSKVFGFTFAVKLMEKGEELAQVNYEEIAKEIPEAKNVEKEEKQHENALLNILDEERLKYVGSMVLGLNDALVELTGALAGLTFALQNTKLIAVTGLITGIAASLSMGASEYLSVKAEEKGEKDPFKASIYTGGMYVMTVALLILPFFVFSNVYLALVITLTLAILIILSFTFYISVAQDLPFKKRFLEMASLSLSVSLLTFGIGYLVRSFLGVDI